MGRKTKESGPGGAEALKHRFDKEFVIKKRVLGRVAKPRNLALEGLRP